MAEIWLGRHREDPAATPVAIKTLRRDRHEPRVEQMFGEEAVFATLFDHPNVVRGLGAGRDHGRPYVVLEWIDGVDLRLVLQRMRSQGRRVPVEAAGYVVRELLSALRYAHELAVDGRPLGLVHRDVTPHNVLVSRQGHVKLTDFGVARSARVETSHQHAKGKLRYMALEHLESRAVPASDLYGVGAILYELLEGTRFRDDATNEVQLYHLIQTGHVPDLRRLGIPERLRRLYRGLLAPDVRARLATARQALDALGDYGSHRGRQAWRDAIAAVLDPSPQPESSHPGPPPIRWASGPSAQALRGATDLVTPMRRMSRLGARLDASEPRWGPAITRSRTDPRLPPASPSAAAWALACLGAMSWVLACACTMAAALHPWWGP